MTNQPASAENMGVAPLRDFAFANAWLAGEQLTRKALPTSDELLKRRLAGLRWTPWSEAEIAELAEFNRAAGNAAGVALAGRLAAPDALVVVTGQQPDLLASPLYVLYKALSAVAWARRLSQELSREVTPMFWVASDDDDFAELKQAWLAAWNGELVDAGQRLSRGSGAKPGAPAYDWDLTESAARVNADIARALNGWPGGERTAWWLADQIAAEPNFERCFCRLLAALLGEEFPMVFVAPRLKAMRRRGAAVLAADVAGHEAVNQTVSRAADELHEAGYPVTLARDDEAVNFFWLHSGHRQRLVKTASGEITAIDPVSRKETARFSDDDLRQMLREKPEDFAPNVVTRPVVQDVALPTALYVAGPGEMAYLALLGEAYAQYGATRSAVAPRAMVALEVKRNAPDWQEGTGLNADAAGLALENENGLSREMLAQLGAMSEEIAQRLNALRAAGNGRGGEIELALEKTDKHIQRGLGQLRRRLARQVAPEAWNRLARQGAIDQPAGKPQERVLSPWNFVKPGEWDALAMYVYEKIDFAQAGPHSVAMPPWLDEAL